MARLPIATRESVPEDQRDVFDEMVQRLGSVPRYGPGSVMIHVPLAHRWATGLNDYLRNESSLPKKTQELAMLVTARELDCQHIWNAHAGPARTAGAPAGLGGTLSPILAGVIADTVGSWAFALGLGASLMGVAGSVLLPSPRTSVQGAAAGPGG